MDSAMKNFPLSKKYEHLAPSWFEFLLDRERLSKHLAKLKQDPTAEPTPCQMIAQFVEHSGVASSPSSNGSGEVSKYSNSLIELMLYVAAWTKWDLETLETGLPFIAQQVVMTALVKHSCDVPYAQPVDMGRELSTLSVAEAAAMVMHARWVVRAFVQINGVPLRPAKPNYIDGSSVSPLQISVDEANGILSTLLPQAVKCLEQVSGLGHALQFPPARTKDCNDITIELSPIGDLKCQVAFELAQVLAFQGEVEKASPLFCTVRELLPNIRPGSVICRVTEKALHGFLVACGLPRKGTIGTPLQKMLDRIEDSRRSQFKGLEEIFVDDNKDHVLPWTLRLRLQEEVASMVGFTPQTHGESSTGQKSSSVDSAAAADTHLRVCISNAVQDVVQSRVVSPAFWIAWQTNEAQQHFAFLLDVSIQSLQASSTLSKHANALRLLSFARAIVSASKLSSSYDSVLQSHHLVELAGQPKQEAMSSNVLVADTDLVDELNGGRDEVNEVRHSEEELLCSRDVEEIRALVHKILPVARSTRGSSLAKWVERVPLSLGEPGVLVHILIMKAQHLQQSKLHYQAEHLLQAAWQVAEGIRDRAKSELMRRLSETQLLLDISQWASLQQQDRQRFRRLVRGAQDFVSKAVSGTVPVSSSLVDSCCSFLLNVRDWAFVADQLGRLDRERCRQGPNFSQAVAATCIQISQDRDARTPARQVWTFVSSVFSAPSRHKRSADGQIKQSIQSADDRVTLLSFLKQISEPTVLGVAIAALARIYNALKLQESQENKEEKISRKHEISSQYSAIWPTSVSNSSSISQQEVMSSLKQLLHHALSHHSSSSAWLCTLADTYLASQWHSAAMKYYLQAGAVQSSFFTQPVSSDVWPDQVYSRMVACCQGLQAYTQAAILCQMTSQVDYTTALQCLQQTDCRDGMESLYDCFWDVSLLEYVIHIHSKCGHHDKRAIAVEAMGNPDLNISNSSDVLRKAVQHRTLLFFRRMADIYL